MNHDSPRSGRQLFQDQDAEQLYRVLFEQAADAIFISDEFGHYIEVNAQACELLGYSREELVGLSVQDLVPLEDVASDPLVFRTLNPGEMIHRERRMVHHDGHFVDTELSVRHLSDGRYMAHVRDTSERKRAETALAQSEERYRTLVENSHDLIHSMSSDGQLRFANATWLRTLEYALDDLPQLSLEHIIEPSDFEHCKHIFQRVLTDGSVDNVRTIFVSKSGRRVHVEGHATARIVEGKISGTLSFFRDITERKEREEDLHNQAAVLDNIAEGINYVDDAGILRYTNAAFDAMFGYERGELIGQPVAILNDVTPEENEKLIGEILAVLNDGQTFSKEFRNRKKDGSAFYTWATIQRLPLQGRAYSITVQEDITERKRGEAHREQLEEQLRQAQKMEGIGRLAGGVAHDFNNLLTIIQGHSELLLASTVPNDPLRDSIEQIQHASERATTLTRQLLAFSRKQMLEPTTVDLNALVNDLSKMLKRLIGEHISLSSKLTVGLWPITIDTGQIEQVLMNLILNARDALPNGGAVTIETSNVYFDAEYALIHPGTSAGPHVMLSVTDDGHGMDEATRARVFEPFFTTKETGKGTGMGMATVYGIINQSGGQIFVYSEPDQGTTVRIYLRAKEEVAASLQPSLPALRASGSETILLVEDEEMVRNLVRVTLQRSGYTILEAQNGKEAVGLIDNYGPSIDLVITDVIMPQMSGRELAEHIKATLPDTKILFTSGYTDDTVVRHGLLAAEVNFLPKPFSPKVLVAKVRDVLNGN